MEVRKADAQEAVAIMQKEYLETTGLAEHDLSTAGAVFDESAVSVVCPACGVTFKPEAGSACPECGLSFG